MWHVWTLVLIWFDAPSELHFGIGVLNPVWKWWVGRRRRPFIFIYYAHNFADIVVHVPVNIASFSRLPCANWRRIYGVEILMPRLGHVILIYESLEHYQTHSRIGRTEGDAGLGVRVFNIEMLKVRVVMLCIRKRTLWQTAEWHTRHGFVNPISVHLCMYENRCFNWF